LHTEDGRSRSPINLYLMSYVSHGVIFGCNSSVHYVVDVMEVV
jgi:hypothetical protein